MHWAARYGDVRLLEMLLSKKAKVITPDYNGCFPIDYAGKFEHSETIKRLVDYSLEMFDGLIAKKDVRPEPEPFKTEE